MTSKCHKRATLPKLWGQTGKQFTVTREMSISGARDQSVQLKVAWCCRRNLSAFFKSCFCYVLFCYITNHSMTGPLGNREFCFPRILENCVPVRNLINNREFKKLRRQLQRKSHIKIELCVKLSLLRLFQVDHVVQNRRTALTLAWYEWFSCKGKEWKIYYCELALSSELQISKFYVVV